jgi:glycosyltransferase involved in cell wall biosynthesis
MQKPRTLAQAAESQIAISVVLNVHREVIYYERTMRSLVEAVEYAKSFNLSVELVVVQDRPDQRTVNWFDAYDYSAFSAHQIITVENGSLGLSRNDGIRVARGEYIATYDADDLVSFNWLARQHEEALRAGRRALIFAQYLIGFGFMSHLVEYFDQKTICNLAYMDAHPYGSRVFGHRSIFEEVPYGDVRLTSGYAYEDWHFNAEVLARGIEFHIAPRSTAPYAPQITADGREEISHVRPRPKSGSASSAARCASRRRRPPTGSILPSTSG